MYVACPHCQGWMVGDQIPVGAAVLCPHCQKQFMMSPAILAGAIHPEAQPTASASSSAGASAGTAASAPSSCPLPTQPAGPAPTSVFPAGSPGSVSSGPAATEPSGISTGGVPMPGPGGGGAGWPSAVATGATHPIAGMGPMPPAGGTPPGMPLGIPTAGMGPPGMPPTGAPGYASMSMPTSPPGQPIGYAQTPAQPAQKPEPIRVRRQTFGVEAFLVVGIGVMIVAIIIVVLLGYGPRPTAENIGKSAEPFSTGPHMEIKYSSTILTIKNCDPFEWKEAEVRINADPADDEGGYRCLLGRMPAGREKKIFLNQCLSPSGSPFQGQIERVVVLAKTVDGNVRYVSEVSVSPQK